MYSLTLLQVAIDIGGAVLGTLLAVAGGTMVAWKLSQLQTTDHEINELAIAQDRWATTQAILERNRAARAARGKKAEAEAMSRNAETQKLSRNDDATVPDLALVESFAVVPMRAVEVGTVRQLRSLVVA